MFKQPKIGIVRGFGASPPPETPTYPWVHLQVKAGQTLIAPSGDLYGVYGIKRKVGEAKATGWITLPRKAVVTASLSSGQISTLNVSEPGAGYVSNPPPTATVSAPPAGGTQATIAVTVDDSQGLSVDGVYITNCGTKYSRVEYSITGGGGSGLVLVPTLRDGKIISMTIPRDINRGTGYTSAPTITIDPSDGGGTRATAVAVLATGRLKFTITNPGAGYTSAPTITVSAPTQQPTPLPPISTNPSGTDWADGIGWGKILGGSLTGGYTSNVAALICHDDRSLVPYGLHGENASNLPEANIDMVLSWYRTMVKLSIADPDADGVLEAWVPMAGGA